MLLIAIVWHGLGVLSLVLILKILTRIRKLLRGVQIKYKTTTILIGVLSGVVGTIFGIYTFYFIDTRFELYSTHSVLFSIRMIVIAAFFASCAYFVALAAECLMPKFCRREATIGVALIVSLLLISQPVYYGWIMWVLSLVTNS